MNPDDLPPGVIAPQHGHPVKAPEGNKLPPLLPGSFGVPAHFTKAVHEVPKPRRESWHQAMDRRIAETSKRIDDALRKAGLW